MSNEYTTSFNIDLSDYKKAMTDAKRYINAANAEFKAASAHLDRWSESTEGLNKKINQLNKVMEGEKAKLASLTMEYQDIIDKETEDSVAAEKHRIKMDKQSATFIKTRKELEKYTQMLEDLKDEQADLQTEYSKLSKKITEQDSELQGLKKEYTNLVLSQGESSDAAIEVASKISKLSDELNVNRKTMLDAEKAASKLIDKQEETSDAFSDAQKSIRLANSEFEKISATMDDWSKSTDGLQAKIEQLNTVVGAEKQKLESLKNQYEAVKKEQGENSAGAQELLVKINNQSAAVTKAEKNLNQYKNKLSELEKTQSRVQTEYEKTSQKIDEQENDLQKLKQEYSNLVISQGKSSDAAQEAAAKIGKLSTELNENKKALQKADEAADDLDKSLSKVDDSSDDLKESFTVMKGAMASLIADGIKKIGSAFVSQIKTMATEGDKAYNSFQAKTGASTEAMGEFKDEINDLYKQGAGDGLEDIADAMAQVKQQTNETDPSKLSEMTENALALRDTYDYDVSESLRAVKMLMDQFGISSEKAYDLIVQGTQQGLNKNGDLLDTINEYSVHYKQLGYNEEQFISSLINGSEKGTFSVDKLGDAMKEFGIRTKDTAESTKDGFELLGYGASASEEELIKIKSKISQVEKNLKYAKIEQKNFNSETSELAKQKNADKIQEYNEQLESLKFQLSDASSQSGKTVEDMQAAFAKGGKSAQKATKEVLEKLMNMDDKVKQNQAGVALFGTMWEDLGIEGVKALTNVNKRIDSSKKSMEEVKKVKYDDISNDFKKVGRSIQTDFIAPLAQKALPYADKFAKYCIDNLDKVVGGLKVVGGTIATVFVINKVATFTNSISSLVKVLTPAGALWTAAGIAIGGLAAAIAKVSKESDASTTEKFIEESKKASEAVRNEIDSWNELKDARNQSVKDTESEFEYYENLKTELDDITYENGQVKEGCEKRAKTITDTLNKALGLEIEWEGKTIESKKKVMKSIDKVIEKKKAEALVSAYQESYTEAIKKQGDALKNVTKQEGLVTTSKNKLIKAQEKYNEALKKFNLKEGETTNNPNVNGVIHGLKSDLDTLQKNYDTQNSTLENYKNTYQDYLTTISNYESAQLSITNGNAEKMQEATSNLTNGLIIAENGTRESLEKQVETYDKKLIELRKTAKKGSVKVTDAQLNEAERLRKEAKKQLNSYITTYEDKVKELKWRVQSAIDAPWLGINTGAGFISGLASTEGDVKKTVDSFSNNAVMSFMESLLIKSPSRVTKKIGIFFSQGFINGVKALYKEVKAEAKNLGGASIDGIMLGVDNGKFESVGEKLVTHFTNAINSQVKKVNKSMKQLITSAIREGQKSIKAPESINIVKKAKKEFADVGEQMINSFSKAIEKGAGKAVKKVKKSISKLSETYQQEYDELIDKQNSLKSTLSDYGDLFERDDNGNIKLSDLKAQTDYIKNYGKNLESLKSKVSSELMSVITSMNVEDGADLSSKLMSLSAADLKAFDNAYKEKLKVSEQVSKTYYKSQIDLLKKNFTTKVNKQLKTLKTDLKEIGKQSVEGFIKGFESKSGKASKYVENWAKGIIKAIKKEWKIHSPSRVSKYELMGNFMQGMIDGVAIKARKVTNTIRDFTSGIVDSANSSISGIRGGMSSSNASSSTNVSNNTATYNFYQTNNSPKALSRLEIYRQGKNLLKFAKGVT